MPTPAARLNQLPAYPFAVLGQRIAEMGKQGIDVIRLDVGSPDMPPPPAVIDALSENAHRDDVHGYAGYKGTPGFRGAVANYYKRRFGVELHPDREVLPLLGSKEGIVNLALAYLDRGDVALVPSLGYPSYAMGTLMGSAEVYWLPVSAANGYKPDFDTIPADIRRRAKLLWLNYPNNPTGATVEVDFYQRAVDFCAQHDILLASDNPYVDVTFDRYVAPSALQADGARTCTVEFMSMSKSHNMAGWRIGAAVGNGEAISTLLQVKSNFDSGHFRAVYDAAAVALETTPQSWIDDRNEIYRQRRDRIMAALPDIGLEAECPLGSMYIWGRALDGQGGANYCTRALDGAHVSLAPGNIYGPDGDDYVRISIGMDDARIDEALVRLKAWWAGTGA
ncbi:MAG: aminotransferase class I/II-fold pyridoxal phosphate-dependent enzyme [Anaerolineae bacterium]|nr:aminotransferase class I/II-fold pyridoxal phosphate-dependent enzyme [Anaerolineae bacterium]